MRFKFRKQYIVNKRFQYSFILKNLLFLIFCFFLMFLALKILEANQTKHGFLFKLPPSEQIISWAETNNISQNSQNFAYEFIKQAEVYSLFNILAKPLIIAVSLALILLIFFNIYYSNKIAGPLYRLKKNIDKKLKNEDIKPIKFRNKDEFQDLADSVNKLIFGENFEEKLDNQDNQNKKKSKK